MSEAQIWERKIQSANNKLRHQNYERKIYTVDELFFHDRGRSTIRGHLVSRFEIFPWLVGPHHRSFRYRESLCQKKGETIEAVAYAINFFFNENFDEEDFLFLNEFYRFQQSPRTLWTIVDLKAYLEDSRFRRYKEGVLFKVVAFSHSCRARFTKGNHGRSDSEECAND
jgi:hypothetical protein